MIFLQKKILVCRISFETDRDMIRREREDRKQGVLTWTKRWMNPDFIITIRGRVAGAGRLIPHGATNLTEHLRDVSGRKDGESCLWLGRTNEAIVAVGENRWMNLSVGRIGEIHCHLPKTWGGLDPLQTSYTPPKATTQLPRGYTLPGVSFACKLELW